MTYFLEITCIAAVAACLLNSDPNPDVPRYYKTRKACNDAAIVVATKWNPGAAAWKFNCLPIKQ